MLITKDQQLINEAKGYKSSEWVLVDGLISEAESEEAKEQLRRTRNRLYRLEEFEAGLL